ncbi:endonuclease domain-containing protein [Streptomyces sp. NPDC050619]|uniref:endonuclease domain-containing protein n=1 Tax=Streptomyces sp. NPDC050619 TaxID=3157214 RepID=UPI003439C3D2
MDHRRRTGKVRGVPCFNCNSAMGKLGVDPRHCTSGCRLPEGTLWNPTLVAPGVYQLPS